MATSVVGSYVMSRSRWKILTAIIALALLGASLTWYAVFSPSVKQLTERAEAAMQAQDYRLAESLSRIALAQSPSHAPAAQINAIAHIQLNDYSAGRQRIKAFQASKPNPAEEQKLLRLVSQAFFDHGRLIDAIEFLPESVDANLQRRIEVARLSGDREALREMLNEPASRSNALPLLLANLHPTAKSADSDLLQRGAETAPADAKALTGLALLAANSGDETNAEKLSADALKIEPNLTTPLAIRANALATTASDSEWRIFVLRLPTSALNEPEVWRAFGRRCEATELKREAMRCYYEAMRQGGDSQQPYEALDRLLRESGDKTLAGVVQRAGAALAEALTLGDEMQQIDIASILDDEGSTARVRTIAKRLAELGRAEEAVAWRNLLADTVTIQEPSSSVEPIFKKLASLGEYPIPEWLARRREQRRRVSETTVDPAD